MKKIKLTIEKRMKQYEQSGFIRFLQNSQIEPKKRLSYLPYAVYFIMIFADVNRLLFPNTEENDIQKMINTHGKEDGKHWAWFLYDLDMMGYNVPMSFNDAIKLIWSNDSVETRRFCYLVVKHCSTSDPVLKLAIIEALEAMGKVWLDSSVQAAREMGMQDKLVYLGDHHSEHEVGHAIGANQDDIENIELNNEQRQQYEKVIHELFDGIDKFYQELLYRVESQDHNEYVSCIQAEEI